MNWITVMFEVKEMVGMLHFLWVFCLLGMRLDGGRSHV